MFTRLKKLRGQSVIVEYAIMFAVVVALIAGMSTFFKRLVQGRISGASHYVQNQLDDVFADSSLNLTGKFYAQYEPYYTQTAMERSTDGTVIDREVGGVGVGAINEREYQDYQTTIQVVSNQLAPKDADF